LKKFTRFETKWRKPEANFFSDQGTRRMEWNDIACQEQLEEASGGESKAKLAS